MSKILKVTHPNHIGPNLLKSLAKEIDSVVHYNDKTEVNFKGGVSIIIKKGK